MRAINPFVDHRVQKLENFLDEYVEEKSFHLDQVKQTISSRYVQNRYDASYKFHIGERFGFYARLYWVQEDGGPIPYLQVEMSLANLPKDWQRSDDFYQFLLEINNGFHDPIKVALLDEDQVCLVLRGRIDKVCPDYWGSLIEDLGECGYELFDKLRGRFGNRIRSMADYIEKMFPEFPKKASNN